MIYPIAEPTGNIERRVCLNKAAICFGCHQPIGYGTIEALVQTDNPEVWRTYHPDHLPQGKWTPIMIVDRVESRCQHNYTTPEVWETSEFIFRVAVCNDCGRWSSCKEELKNGEAY